MQEDDALALAFGQLFWPVLVVHVDVVPAPRSALDARDHEARLLAADHGDRKLAVREAGVVPAVPKVAGLGDAEPMQLRADGEAHGSSEHLHDVGFGWSTSPAWPLLAVEVDVVDLLLGLEIGHEAAELSYQPHARSFLQ